MYNVFYELNAIAMRFPIFIESLQDFYKDAFACADIVFFNEGRTKGNLTIVWLGFRSPKPKQ